VAGVCCEQGVEGITVVVAGGMDEHSHIVFRAAKGGQPALPRLKHILPFHGERVQEWQVGDEGRDVLGRLDWSVGGIVRDFQLRRSGL